MFKSICTVLCLLVIVAWAGTDTKAQTGRKSVSAAEVNGTFRMNFTGKFRGNSNEIKILALGGGRLRVAMDLTHPYVVNGEMTANVGQMDGEALIKGDTAVYSSSEFGQCNITINFVKPGIIKVSQDGSDASCGFGNHVTSSGTYRKVSGKRPTFASQ